MGIDRVAVGEITAEELMAAYDAEIASRGIPPTDIPEYRASRLSLCEGTLRRLAERGANYRRPLAAENLTEAYLDAYREWLKSIGHTDEKSDMYVRLIRKTRHPEMARVLELLIERGFVS